ncbi:bile acid:sodium symporter family protein [Mumia zhuanghuii]|uniref:Bile acid:sodium symporter family protein n=2 Tax=Mumia TaxID=1546255 RepID=A0ABW1QPP4_9ACTN|nr:MULTISPECIES: bile acid:sodium symporter family protein [Mumia]KAA1420377.1 bile acid:sodium symporter family protein [Mumia zhuanghuii]
MITASDVDAITISFNESSLTLLKIVLGAILFGVALDTRLEDFRAAVRKPVAMAVGIGGQFLLLPAITFCLTLVLGVRGSIALGMILVACCPPGNVSNILTHRARGDVALSVSMTSVGNVLAIFLMPLNFAFWGGLHPTGQDFLTDIEVGPWAMLSEVLLVIGIPFVLGLTVARLWPNVAARSHGLVSRVASLALGAIIIVGITGNWDVFVNYIGVVLIAVFLHDALALLLGYSIARGARLSDRSTRAMTFEVGIRNAGFGLLLVFEFFDGLGGMALVAAWWGIWDIIAGLFVATLWARRPVRDEKVEVPA